MLHIVALCYSCSLSVIQRTRCSAATASVVASSLLAMTVELKAGREKATDVTVCRCPRDWISHVTGSVV